MINKIFKLKENNTTVSTEIIAGLTTFLTMSYIIFVAPQILSKTGMDYNALYASTIITTILATLLIGLVANVPYAQSIGIGLSSLFTYTICGTMGYTWQQGLAIVFICGVINTLITFTKLRKKIIEAIPSFLQEAIGVGIGLFITYVGLLTSGVITFASNEVINGYAQNVTPTMASFSDKGVLLTIIGVLITIILIVKKVKYSYLFGILITTIIGIPLGVTQFPSFTNYTILPDISPTLFKLDFTGLFTAKNSIIVLLMTITTITLSDLFDTIGVFISTGNKSGIFKMNNDGTMPDNLNKALFADAAATIIGSLLGTSFVTTYIESNAGIEAGGRTGLTSISTAFFFFLALFISPIIAIIPMQAASAILILIGLSMIGNITNIDWDDMLVAIPSFFVIIMMSFAYSITTGIEFGFITYVLVNLFSSKRKKISLIIYIFTILFIIDFIYKALI